MTTATTPSVLPLRPYQQEAHDAILEALGRGVHRQLVSMPTGSGKTLLAAHLVKTLHRPTVFVVHRDELAKQSVRSLNQTNPGQSIGVCKADRDELGADLIVASAQTLAQPIRLERLRRALVGRGPVLHIEDEAHHSAAPSRMRAIEAIGAELLVGLTATPERGDKIGLGHIYEEIDYHIGMLDLMAQNRLAPLKGLRIDTAADLDDIHTRAGEFVESELADTVDSPERNKLIVESWLRHAGGRQRTVAFCVNVQHALHLAEEFRWAGIRAETILGSTPEEERARIFHDFHEGLLPVLVNVMVCTEGWDEPAIDCILMTRPTKSRGLYVQMAGRAARRSEGKQDALIVDYVDNTSKHKLVTFPTLAGREPSLPGEGKPASNTSGEAEPVDLMALAESDRKLRERRAVEVDLFGASTYRWDRLDGLYTAKGEDGWLVLIEQDGGYLPTLVSPGGKGRGVTSRSLFSRPLDVETAMSLAEDAIPLNPLTRKDAYWRTKKEPPTEGQLKIARFLRIDVPAGITKAEISDLIDVGMFRRSIREAGLLRRQG